MNYSIIAGRYAKALFLVGTDNDCLEALKADVELLSDTIEKNPSFAHILDSPIIKPEDKRRVMNDLLSKRVHPMTMNFINTLIKNKREIMLPDISRRFIELYEQHKGIVRAHIVSASPLDESSKSRLKKQLDQLFGADVLISAKVQPELIGGFIFKVDDVQYDASISSGLQRMRKQLTSDK